MGQFWTADFFSRTSPPPSQPPWRDDYRLSSLVYFCSMETSAGGGGSDCCFQQIDYFFLTGFPNYYSVCSRQWTGEDVRLCWSNYRVAFRLYRMYNVYNFRKLLSRKNNIVFFLSVALFYIAGLSKFAVKPYLKLEKIRHLRDLKEEGVE
jgi:hypothetical protein